MSNVSLQTTGFSCYGTLAEDRFRRSKALEIELTNFLGHLAIEHVKIECQRVTDRTIKQLELPPANHANDLAQTTIRPNTSESRNAIFEEIRSKNAILEEAVGNMLKELQTASGLLTRPSISQESLSWLGRCGYDETIISRLGYVLGRSVKLMNLRVAQIEGLQTKIQEYFNKIQKCFTQPDSKNEDSFTFSSDSLSLNSRVSRAAVNAYCVNLLDLAPEGHFGIIEVLLAKKPFPLQPNQTPLLMESWFTACSSDRFLTDDETATETREEPTFVESCPKRTEKIQDVPRHETERNESFEHLISDDELGDSLEAIAQQLPQGQDKEPPSDTTPIIQELNAFLSACEDKINQENIYLKTIEKLYTQAHANRSSYDKASHSFTFGDSAFEVFRNATDEDLQSYKTLKCKDRILSMTTFTNEFKTKYQFLGQHMPDESLCQTLQRLRVPTEPIKTIAKLFQDCTRQQRLLNNLCSKFQETVDKVAQQLDTNCFTLRHQTNKLGVIEQRGWSYKAEDLTHLTAALADPSQISITVPAKEEATSEKSKEEATSKKSGLGLLFLRLFWPREQRNSYR